MKSCLSLILLFCCINGFTQLWQGRIVDKETGISIGYVTISYSKSTTRSYSDTNGIFYINRQIIDAEDTIHFSHVGYKPISTPVKNILQQNTIGLEKAVNELEAVEIKVCPNASVVKLNNFRGINFHFGTGPGIGKGMGVTAVYDNTLQQPGYLQEISYHVAGYSGNLDIPFRLHWYEWDEVNNKKERELTDTNFIVYPKKKRWNKIKLPPRMIYVDKKIVVSFEFLFPADLQKEYWELSGDFKSMHKWMDKNIWYLGLIKLKDKPPMGGKIPASKPALNFKIRVCN
jgi:hypothetical protein